MKLLAFLLALSAGQAFAQSPIIVSPDGTYLGELNDNRYSADSVANPYGRYGSKYSADSINNEFGKYGSRYSNQSPNNPYASEPPVIIRPRY